MYYGNIKTYSEALIALKRLGYSMGILVLVYCAWSVLISSPSTLDDLARQEGMVVEKWSQKINRGPDEYRFRVQTSDGQKLLKIRKRLINDCCFLDNVPVNKIVSVWTSQDMEGIFLYQMTHSGKLILSFEDVKIAIQVNHHDLLLLGGAMLLLGVVMHIVTGMREARKNDAT